MDIDQSAEFIAGADSSAYAITQEGHYVSAIIYGNTELGLPYPNSYSALEGEVFANPVTLSILDADTYTIISKSEAELIGKVEFLNNNLAKSVSSAEGEFIGGGDVDFKITGASKSQTLSIFTGDPVILENIKVSTVSNAVGIFTGNYSVKTATFINAASSSKSQGFITQTNTTGSAALGKTVSNAQAVFSAFPQKISEESYNSYIVGECVFTAIPSLYYTQKSSDRGFLVEKRTLFGPESLSHIIDADELY